MNLADWNQLSQEEASREIALCCGSKEWALKLVEGRPYETEQTLFQEASATWNSLSERDWLEAFASHPKIGEKPSTGDSRHQAWATNEQAGTAIADAETKAQLSLRNEEYERKFGFIYIVCATGKSVEQMLGILEERLNNSREQELKTAAKQQEQITALRLRKWLDS